MAWWSSYPVYPTIFLQPDLTVKQKQKTKKAIRISFGNITRVEKL